MPDPRHTPSDIAPSSDGSRLTIHWKDGVESSYLPRALRLACPCARCVDETTGIRTLRPEDVPDDVYPVAIHYVGRYALQFVWSDSHQTGFYPFDYLRALWETA